MNVDHLRYFLVLTEEMHYGRAAARLNISQSGLSHAIAALERELGAPLFQKCGRGIELGRYGSVLLPEAQRIVGLADRCAQSFRQLHRGVGGGFPLNHPPPRSSSSFLICFGFFGSCTFFF